MKFLEKFLPENDKRFAKMLGLIFFGANLVLIFASVILGYIVILGN